jgi:hypothetical protein
MIRYGSLDFVPAGPEYLKLAEFSEQDNEPVGNLEARYL